MGGGLEGPLPFLCAEVRMEISDFAVRTPHGEQGKMALPHLIMRRSAMRSLGLAHGAPLSGYRLFGLPSGTDFPGPHRIIGIPQRLLRKGIRLRTAETRFFPANTMT